MGRLRVTKRNDNRYEGPVRLRFLLVFACLPAMLASGQVTLPRILTNHMVVQRDLPVHVWGLATAGQQVSVTFRGETRTTRAGELGRWSVYLAPGAAGGPFQMTIRGTAVAGGAEQAIALDDVMVGDVWVASGQSNMEFEMRKAATAAQDLPNATNPNIRLLIVQKKGGEYPQDDVVTDGWKASSPESAREFSAAAWYFARDIAQREHVAVGVIDSTWGGSLAEAWTSLAALGEDGSLSSVIAGRGEALAKEADANLEDQRRERLRAEAKAAGKPEPQFPWHPPLPISSLGGLWNAMVAPLTPLPIRGVLWYQGESNSRLDRAPAYYHVFRTLIEDWRQQWGIGDFPFLYVQISNFKSNASEDWATLRQQQLRALELRNTAMAVTIDIGNPDDVHPTDKLDVGLRLARAARALSYGEAVEYNGPLFRQATPEGNAIRIWFDHAAGLMAKGAGVSGVEVAGADGKFVPAVARIEGNTIVASSANVAEPRFVRYGWANSPQCNLFNAEGLPASPFTSVR